MKAVIASIFAAATAADESVTVYHMFQAKYTGLANKDGADYDGEVTFIFDTFQPFEASNPEAAIADNIFEMSTVNVTGFGRYAECNAPGCTGIFNCPAGNTDYCCQTRFFPYPADRNTKPGREAAKAVGRGVKAKGYWYSFPKESQGNTWKETVQRRIKSACLAQAWRDEAGGCPDCSNLASSCVADCIQSKLVVNGDDSKLKATWDRVFSNTTLCPDEPFPSSTVVV